MLSRFWRSQSRSLVDKLGYSPVEYAVELDPDEGSGVLLSELLRSAAVDLDRISSGLEAVRDELGRDAPETGQ